MSDLKIFTENIEDTALEQINKLISLDVFKESKVRIMPDVHAGTGCVIGFTADLGDKVIPNIVGVDIGCGMYTVKLGKADIDLKSLDDFIHENIPHGFMQNQTQQDFSAFLETHIYEICKRIEIDDLRQRLGVGSLGGGNHFIEVDIDGEGEKYLVIHSGSRNFGLQVSKYHQKIAEEHIKKAKKELQNLKNKEIGILKQKEKLSLIQDTIKIYDESIKEMEIPKELSFLEGEERKQYLEDMIICQQFAKESREIMAEKICKFLNIDTKKCFVKFHTVHNYIDIDSNIVRKGAISAKKNEVCLIPMNMRDGSLLCLGKGNEDWNYSAPHGAGRLMGRKEAKEKLSIDEFESEMSEIYTTTANEMTLDEAPMAYKPMGEIIKNISDVVEIIDILKPIYNFKSDN